MSGYSLRLGRHGDAKALPLIVDQALVRGAQARVVDLDEDLAESRGRRGDGLYGGAAGIATALLNGGEVLFRDGVRLTGHFACCLS